MPLPRGYAEFAAPPSLAGVITCLWTRTGRTGADQTRSMPVLPDACTDLIWASGVGVIVAGPDTKANTTSFGSASTFVGIRFAPGNGGAAFGVPLSEIGDERLDAGEAWDVRRRSARSTRLLAAFRAVDDAETPGDAMVALLRFGTAVATDVGERADAAHAAGLMLHPGATVTGVAAELGSSERQLHRMFAADVGYGPKTLQRVARFQRFLVGHERTGSLSEAAAWAGYADQSHLTRECVALSGMTPGSLAARR